MPRFNRQEKLVGGVLIAVALVGVAGWSLRASRQEHASRRKGAAPPLTDSAGQRQAFPQNGASGDEGPSAWPRDRRSIYETTFAVEFGQRAGNKNENTGVTGRAVLDLSVQSTEAGRATVRGTVGELSVTARAPDGTQPHIESKLGEAMFRPFLIDLRPDGYVETIHVDTALHGMGRNILRALIAGISFVRFPGAGNSKEWSTEESDQNGVTTAQYLQTAPRTYRKTKGAYKILEMTAHLPPHKKGEEPTISFEGTQTVGSDGALESSSSLEKLAVILGQTEFRAETRVTLKLRERGQATAGPIVDAAGAGLLASTLYATGPADAVSAGDANEQRRRLVAGATAVELMRDMAALPASKENQEARWNVKRRLTALVELDPSSTTAIARRLKTGASPEEGEMLLAALADSNRPEAQAALAALAADPEAPGRVRGAAVIHLGLQQHPSEETLSSLSALVDQADGDQLKNSALLALGSAARQAAAADNAAAQPAAKDAVEKLKTGYGAASDPEQRKVFLAALGNAGDPSTLSTIKAALSDEDPAVRAGAVASLRNIPGAEADGLILGVLPDTDGRVRNAALSALSDRPMTTPILEAVEGIARNDAVASLRAQAVLILGRNLALPGAQATLEWVRDHDPVDKVRAAAASSLQSPLAIRKN